MPVINSTLPESIREYLSYDPLTGHFHWIKLPTNRVKVGDRAGCLALHGYMTIRFRGRLYLSHRLAWLFMYGCWPDDQIDHINGYRADNRFCNLRDVFQSGNSKNSSLKCTNTSGICGVRWNNKHSRWESEIKENGNKHYLGRFKNLFDACCARKSAEVRYNFHPNHGKPRNYGTGSFTDTYGNPYGVEE